MLALLKKTLMLAEVVSAEQIEEVIRIIKIDSSKILRTFRISITPNIYIITCLNLCKAFIAPQNIHKLTAIRSKIRKKASKIKTVFTCYFCIMISIRLFFCLFSGVSFGATG